MKNINQKYSYINHPNHLPLQINGNSKKRTTPIKKQDFNGDKGHMHEQEKSFIMRKMQRNIHNFQNVKSVLPLENSRTQERKKSIKTFKQDRENNLSSGIQYLMDKTSHITKINHRQKAHFQSTASNEQKITEKKHFKEQINQKENLQEKQPKIHKQTMDMKLAKDIYSNVYRMQYENLPQKKKESSNLFKNSQDLGLEKKRQVKLSDNKMREIIGSDSMKGNQGGLRERRQDWRISNINFF